MKYLLIILLFISCKKEEGLKEGKITFYQTGFTSYTRLYVDGEKIGDLYKSNQMPVCGDKVVYKYITITLKAGVHHEYYLADQFGNHSVKRKLLIESDCKQVEVK